MKSKAKKRILTLISAVMLCMAAFPLTAYAGGGDEIPEEPTELAVVETTSELLPRLVQAQSLTMPRTQTEKSFIRL